MSARGSLYQKNVKMLLFEEESERFARGHDTNFLPSLDYGTERLKEAGYINGSLSALGNVVAALGRAELDRPHIPFRWVGLRMLCLETIKCAGRVHIVQQMSPQIL